MLNYLSRIDSLLELLILLKSVWIFFPVLIISLSLCFLNPILIFPFAQSCTPALVSKISLLLFYCNCVSSYVTVRVNISFNVCFVHIDIRHQISIDPIKTWNNVGIHIVILHSDWIVTLDYVDREIQRFAGTKILLFFERFDSADSHSKWIPHSIYLKFIRNWVEKET